MKTIIALLLVAFSSFSEETTLLLIRHGETDWNKQQRIQGQSNIPLNEEGLSQAKKLATYMESEHPDIEVIYSSDLDRAYVTALETAQKFALEVEKRSTLRESYTGEAEGLTYDESDKIWGKAKKEIVKKYSTQKERWDHTPVPGAESRNQVLARTKSEILDIAKRHPGKKIAVFTHGAVIRNLIEENSAYPGDIHNCGVATFEYKENDLIFVKLHNHK